MNETRQLKMLEMLIQAAKRRALKWEFYGQDPE
jgi:hypothetical protein